MFCFYFGILADDTPPVGLAAYAAGGIAQEDPIRVGIQGFKYDMRTALLPFMFIFNTQILLIGINSFLEALKVFICCLIAMFSFAVVTQGMFARKTSLFQRGLLLLVTLVLFRPDLANQYYSLGINLWQVIGILVFFGVYFYQKMRPISD